MSSKPKGSASGTSYHADLTEQPGDCGGGVAKSKQKASQAPGLSALCSPLLSLCQLLLLLPPQDEKHREKKEASWLQLSIGACEDDYDLAQLGAGEVDSCVQ